VHQQNLCALEIMPPFVLLAFSPNKVSWHLPYFKNILISQKQEPRPILQQGLYQNQVFLKNYRDQML
jgi:hypothetical protein